MSPLDAAFNDVLRAILDECGQRELYHLSLVSRRLHILVESRLYSTVQSTWTHIKDPITFLLLRSVLGRPGLAILVQKLIFRSDPTFFTGKVPGSRGRENRALPVNISPPKDEEELMKVFAVIRHSEISPRDATLWTHEIREGSIDAPLAVLLFLLPNLASISLDENFTRTTKSLSVMLKYALRLGEPAGISTSIPGFTSLRKVNVTDSVSITTDAGGITVLQNPHLFLFFLQILYSPGIQHISATVDDPGLLVWPIDVARSSTITSLFLSKIREGNLGQILSHCPNLQTLFYHWYVDEDCSSPLPPFLDCQSLEHSLSYVQKSLKSLWVAVEFQPTVYECQDQYPESGIIGTITTLHKFLLLEKLEIPFVLLLGPREPADLMLGKLLPPKLRQLSLTEDFAGREDTDGMEVDDWEDAQTFLAVLRNWLVDST